MSTFRMFQKIKTKEVEPKVYALSISAEDNSASGLHIVVAYSLEEAHELGAKEFKYLSGFAGSVNIDARYVSVPLSQLTKESLEYRLVHRSVNMRDKETKNFIMNHIVENGDEALYKDLKWRFSSADRRFLEDRLKTAKEIIVN